MIIDSTQQFVLDYPGPLAGALAFVRDPAWSLSRVRFLHGLTARTDGVRGGLGEDGDVKERGELEVRGELIVQLPVLGQVDLPFFSVLQFTEGGATLIPQLLEHERAWVEVRGVAQVGGVQVGGGQVGGVQADSPDPAGTPVGFDFQFRAHLAMPQTGDPPQAGAAGPGWGGAAFGKMVRAAANRTLQRVASDLPAGIREAMHSGRM